MTKEWTNKEEENEKIRRCLEQLKLDIEDMIDEALYLDNSEGRKYNAMVIIDCLISDLRKFKN